MSESASHVGKVVRLFLLLSSFECHVALNGKKREKRICKHLFARFRLVLLRGHATRCYAVNQWYFHLVTQPKRPANGRLGLKLFHLVTQPKRPAKPTLGPKASGSTWKTRGIFPSGLKWD